MRRLAVLACITLLASCSGEIGTGQEGDLVNIAIVGQVPTNGIVFFPDNLAAFTSSPLASETFDPSSGPPELIGLPFDDETRKFIKYTVECALDPGQAVRFQGDVYNGLIGQCPSWNKDKPTKDCLEAVSGCLLARNNPTGLTIPLSMRALLPENPPIDPFVTALAGTHHTDPVGLPIDSFHADCLAGEDGETRNCGWDEDTALVGICEPGALVQVGAGARLGVGGCMSALGTLNSGNPVIRVNREMNGDDEGGQNHLASSDDVCDEGPAVDFTCPDSGVFNVMLSGFKQGEPFDAEVGAASGSPVEFPIKISELYELLEGSYWGTVFASINPNVTLVRQGEGFIIQLAEGSKDHTGFGSRQVFPFEDAWCCNDPGFDPAYLDNARACAKQPVLDPKGKLGEANMCMCRPLGACNVVAKNHKANRCPIYDTNVVLGDVDHDDCKDGFNIPRKWPMTVFLHAPCDMVGGGGEGQTCGRK